MKTYNLNKIPTFKAKTKNLNYQSQSKQISNFLKLKQRIKTKQDSKILI